MYVPTYERDGAVVVTSCTVARGQMGLREGPCPVQGGSRHALPSAVVVVRVVRGRRRTMAIIPRGQLLIICKQCLLGRDETLRRLDGGSRRASGRASSGRAWNGQAGNAQPRAKACDVQAIVGESRLRHQGFFLGLAVGLPSQARGWRWRLTAGRTQIPACPAGPNGAAACVCLSPSLPSAR